MGDIAETPADTDTKSVFHTRSYQQELLEESLRSNIIIALDTGSGKTHIAVLRIKHEVERETRKVSWFFAPTVALVEQQCDVIRKAIPVAVCMISGASEPNQWKDGALWRRVLESHRIIVSTPQVLLDALLHGYVNLGKDVGLLVFDEAHHAVAKHPYNMIMQQFYFSLEQRTRDSGANDCVRPMILGLTASPIYGGNPDAAFYKLEHNLDSVVRSSRMHREELAQYVHRPAFKHALYEPPRYTYDTLPSRNCFSLRTVVASLNIEDDPSIKSLRAQLARVQRGSDEWLRLDQKLSKKIHKADTFTHRGLRDFLRTAEEICMELGEWAADWYVAKVVEQGQRAANPYNNIMGSWQANEKSYILENLEKVTLVAVPSDPEEIRQMLSPKVEVLVACLQAEEADFTRANETYSGLIFVTRRDSVIALAEVLSRLPETSQLFRIGCLLGSSSSFKRHAFLDVTREIVKDSQVNTLAEFRGGDKNLIVSTSVAEEGIDIQACGSVIRFDPPPNVVAWAQSRGRARRQRSSFIMMLEQDKQHELVIQKWIQLEEQMMALYTDPNRNAPETFEKEDEHDGPIHRVPSTGAVLTLDSATSHLNHFCSILPNAAYGGQLALYDLDPPDYPEDWHSQQDRIKDLPPYQGPWGATVTLPRCVPERLRVFSTPREHSTKRLAQKHAAFAAYKALHEAELLDDNLLPITDAIQPDKGEEVKKLLADVEKRASTEKVSVQMDPWAANTDEEWWKAEVTIDGLPALTMLTRNPLSPFAEDEMPTIYIPGRGATRVWVRFIGRAEIDKTYLERARTYTYRLFWTLYFARMKPDDRDFAYLFLPAVDGPDEQVWEERRRWMQRRIDNGTTMRLETPSRANADALHEQYGLPADLALVRPNEKFGKAFQFARWFDGPLSDKDEETLRERYNDFPDANITFPLLQVTEFPQRANFLVPLASNTTGLGRAEAIYLLPKYATVEFVSKDDLQYAMYFPSILRWITNALTVLSLREELLSPSPVAQIPFKLLRIATTAPVAQEMMSNEQPLNYERLETLGDCVLKCMVSTQLYADHPLWHEGYLARRKDHAVSNMQLAKAAVEKSLYKWIIRDRFVPRKWKPRYLSDVVEEPLPEPKAAEVEGKEGKKKKQTQELSTKVLADVVESLLGAAFEHGGFDLATQCAEIFGLGLSWKTLSTHITEVLEAHEEVDVSPPQLELVERMLGYTFERKALLIQALTHASYTGDLKTISYERLEFLGDCALDMVVTNMLFHAEGRNYKPGHMHMRKEATVNAHFLAYFCLKTFTTCETPNPTWSPTTGVTVGTEENKIYLWQCLLHSSHRVLEDQHIASTRFEKSGPDIEKALRERTIYPWAALTSLQAPKFLSDMVESLLGAVFLDSDGNFSTVSNVLRTLGVMDVLERIILRDEMDVLHPISRLTIWVAKQVPQQSALKLEVDKLKGNVSCTVLIDGEPIATVEEVYRSRASQEQVRFAAAEQAIKRLHVLEAEEIDVLNEEDNTWGDELPNGD